MPVKGTFAALQKLKPIDIDWGKVAETGVKREDILDARKKAEEKARQERRDKLDYDVLEPVITGVDSLDKGLTMGLQSAATMQHGDFKKALNDPNYADSAEYKIRTKNLNNWTKDAKATTDATAKLAGKVIAKSNDGTLSGWDNELLQIMNGAFVSEAVAFGVKQDGSFLATIALTDQELVTDDNPRGFVKDEDGKIKMKQVTPSEIFKGLGGFSITADVDILEIATDIGTKLGKSIESDIEGYTITTEQSWEKKKEETRKIARGLLGSSKTPTALAKRLWADEMGEESRTLTEENMVEIEDKLLEKIKPFYDEEVKKTKSFAAQESARKAARAETKGDVTPEYVVDPSTGEATVTQVNGVDANIISFGDGKGISIMSTEAKKESIQNIYVDKYGGIYADKIEEVKYKGDPIYIEGAEKTPDNIDWLATVAQQKAKGWETKTESKVKLTDTDFTNLAKNPKMVDDKGRRFKDGRALKVFLEKRKELLPKSKSEEDKIITESGNTYN